MRLIGCMDNMGVLWIRQEWQEGQWKGVCVRSGRSEIGVSEKQWKGGYVGSGRGEKGVSEEQWKGGYIGSG